MALLFLSATPLLVRGSFALRFLVKAWTAEWAEYVEARAIGALSFGARQVDAFVYSLS
jgi:hypothetical protein